MNCAKCNGSASDRERGANRTPCFRTDADYLVYLSNLRRLSAKHGCTIHAYCLMTNHVHLLLTPDRSEGCTAMMRDLGQRYVPYFNSRLGRTGTLWEGRFRSCIAESAHYVLACYRYIELNPVRAGMVDKPAQYRWSSHATNAGDRATGWLTPHGAYASVGVSAYRDLCNQELPGHFVEEIRKATRIGYPMGAKRRSRGRPWDSQMRKIGSVPI